MGHSRIRPETTVRAMPRERGGRQETAAACPCGFRIAKRQGGAGQDSERAHRGLASLFRPSSWLPSSGTGPACCHPSVRPVKWRRGEAAGRLLPLPEGPRPANLASQESENKNSTSTAFLMRSTSLWRESSTCLEEGTVGASQEKSNTFRELSRSRGRFTARGLIDFGGGDTDL